MKKLMTILASAATLCAVGAANGDALTTTGFETVGYVAGQNLSTTNDDYGNASGAPSFAGTWVPLDNLEDGVAVVTAYGGEGAAVAADVAAATGVAVGDLESNYLKLESAPLISRYAVQQDQDDFDPANPKSVDIGDGLYIDTLVQFTAADPETPPETNEGDKLCIWLAENTEDATQCTLMVGAGFVGEVGFIDPTNYVTTTKLANNSWHRLQVKVLAAIDSESEVPLLSDGFVVFIDGTAVATTTCPINEEFVGDYVLNARAQKYMTAGSYSLFPSLVQQGGGGAGTITSLSFSGSGAVDNLTFAQGADIDPILIPQALEPVVNGVSFTYTGEEIEAVSYPEGAYGYEFEDESNIATEVGDNYTTTATLFPGYAWYDGSTASKTYNWSIVAGGGSSGYDSGDGVNKFEIATAKKTELETALSSISKTLTDTVPGSSTLSYAQAYALGLWDETDTDVDDLDATITVGADGKVTVTLANAPAEGYIVTCNVYEKASLTGSEGWTLKTSYAYGSETAFTPGSATAGFYKVEVVIRNALQD